MERFFASFKYLIHMILEFFSNTLFTSSLLYHHHHWRLSELTSPYGLYDLPASTFQVMELQVHSSISAKLFLYLELLYKLEYYNEV